MAISENSNNSDLSGLGKTGLRKPYWSCFQYIFYWTKPTKILVRNERLMGWPQSEHYAGSTVFQLTLSRGRGTVPVIITCICLHKDVVVTSLMLLKDVVTPFVKSICDLPASSIC